MLLELINDCQHKNNTNSSTFTDNELKFGEIVADTHTLSTNTSYNISYHKIVFKVIYKEKKTALSLRSIYFSDKCTGQ